MATMLPVSVRINAACGDVQYFLMKIQKSRQDWLETVISSSAAYTDS